jgi:hypothetical protein
MTYDPETRTVCHYFVNYQRIGNRTMGMISNNLNPYPKCESNIGSNNYFLAI